MTRNWSATIRLAYVFPISYGLAAALGIRAISKKYGRTPYQTCHVDSCCVFREEYLAFNDAALDVLQTLDTSTTRSYYWEKRLSAYKSSSSIPQCLIVFFLFLTRTICENREKVQETRIFVMVIFGILIRQTNDLYQNIEYTLFLSYK